MFIQNVMADASKALFEYLRKTWVSYFTKKIECLSTDKYSLSPQALSKTVVDDTKRISKLQLQVNRLTMTRFLTTDPLHLSKLQMKLFCPREPAGDV